MTEFVTTIAGDSVGYDRLGTGPTLIFVAGAGPHRGSDPLTSATAALVADHGITPVVYDRLGRGASQVEGTIDLARELAAIRALIEATGGSAVLCGHSSGGTIALAAAASGLPVTGLVLWEAPIGGISGGAGAWAEEVARLTAAGDFDGAQSYYMKDMPPEWLEGARNSPIWPSMLAQVPSLGPDADSLAWAESAPLAELLADVRIPVEVLYGAEAMPIMRQAADRIVAAVPRAKQKSLAGQNHAWEASAMADELVRFVTAATQAG
jgi:pimeloyl-ACP methyl ester carboxylesterase